MTGNNGQVKSVIEIATDITEKTMLHKEAERMAQLASVGELAAGVAHEINNPVNGVINCAELLVNKAGPNSREHELGKRILKEGDRIASIVKGLLSFSRQESEEMGPAEVPDLLADTLALTEAQMKKEGITLRVDTGKEALSIRAQPHRLEQVFLNLINNARDALNEKYPRKNEGKMLSIVAKRVATDSGPRVRIAFHDQGAGIPPQVMSRVMNPFFSTKPAGKGTGLGLSISHGIVESHGGRLTIDSREGEFTEVVVELPLDAANSNFETLNSQ
jgi:signal transduction histidine kinase